MLHVLTPLTSTFLDYPDDESQAILVFIMGCERNCKGCHNPEFKDYYYEKAKTFHVIMDLGKLIKKECDRHMTDKVVLTGGDPLAPRNMKGTTDLLRLLKIWGLKTMVYTAYDINYVNDNLMSGFEFIKCGEYKEHLKQASDKTDEHIVFASSNQQLYDRDLNLLTTNGIYPFKKEPAHVV